jgi:integrase
MRKITLKLTQRSDGRFAKRIDGQYLVWPDEDTARAAVIELARRREIGVSDTTVPATPTDPPLRVIANLFRAARKPHVQPSTWADYETAIDQFLASVGKHRVSSSLRPDDFARCRERWAAKLGPWKLDNRVQSVRTMFRWAAETARLIDRVPWYGDAFHKTAPMEKRRVQRDHVAAHGERIFTTAELKKIIKAVRGPLRAFVLLGLNGGMYAADIAQLRPADLRKEKACHMIDNDRGKTGVRRRFVLWPETVEAMEVCRRGKEFLFVTAHGNPWVRGETNSIALLFGRLLNDLKIKRAGVNFGALRHTHVSAVSSQPDLNAARLVRGHKFTGIESHYDFPDLKRIRAVTNLARVKLLTSVHRARASRRKSA